LIFGENNPSQSYEKKLIWQRLKEERFMIGLIAGRALEILKRWDRQGDIGETLIYYDKYD
jgi:hypothetical protein